MITNNPREGARSFSSALIVVCWIAVTGAAGPPGGSGEEDRSGASASRAAAPVGLLCELLEQPEKTEITDPRPEFSWIVTSSVNDDVQTAYQVRVAAAPEALERPGDCLWDSGKVASDRSVAVSYAGRPLESHHTYRWKVRTWNKAGAASGWSESMPI